MFKNVKSSILFKIDISDKSRASRRRTDLVLDDERYWTTAESRSESTRVLYRLVDRYCQLKYDKLQYQLQILPHVVATRDQGRKEGEIIDSLFSSNHY